MQLGFMPDRGTTGALCTPLVAREVCFCVFEMLSRCLLVSCEKTDHQKKDDSSSKNRVQQQCKIKNQSQYQLQPTTKCYC